MAAEIAIIGFVLAFQVALCVGVPLTLSTYLCEYHNTKFGVFGICQGDICHVEPLGYWDLRQGASFELPSNARVSISYLLLVHPIAAGASAIQLAIVCFLITRSMFTASWVLTLALFWTFPTFLLALLTFLVDLILFTPHLSWFGWMQLVCTVLIATAGSLSCVLKRTVTSRDEIVKQDNFIYLENWDSEGDNTSLFTAENSQFTDVISSYRSESPILSMGYRNMSRDTLSTCDLFLHEEH